MKQFFSILLVLLFLAMAGGNIFLFAQKNKTEMQLTQEKLLSEKWAKELSDTRDSKEKIEEERDTLRLDSLTYLTTNDNLQKELDALRQKMKTLEESSVKLAELRDTLAQKEKQIEALKASGAAGTALLPAASSRTAAQQEEFQRMIVAKHGLEKAKASLETEKQRLSVEVKKLAREASRLEETLTAERAVYHYNLGVAYAEAKFYDEAIEAYEKSLEIDENNPDACYNLGLVYSEVKRDYATAAVYYRKYLKLKPNAEDREAINQLIEKNMAFSFR